MDLGLNAMADGVRANHPNRVVRVERLHCKHCGSTMTTKDVCIACGRVQ